MLLVYFAVYFVAIMVGLVLPFMALLWWFGETFDLSDIGDMAVVVAIISWVMGFWNWMRDLPGEDN